MDYFRFLHPRHTAYHWRKTTPPGFTLKYAKHATHIMFSVVQKYAAYKNKFSLQNANFLGISSLHDYKKLKPKFSAPNFCTIYIGRIQISCYCRCPYTSVWLDYDSSWKLFFLNILFYSVDEEQICVNSKIEVVCLWLTRLHASTCWNSVPKTWKPQACVSEIIILKPIVEI